MKGKIVIFAVIILLLSAVPRILNYQGKLTTRDGSGITGVYNMTFRIYEADTGGIPLWTETRPVDVSQGLFSVYLGGTTPFPDSLDFSKQYWLEVEVDGEVMSPRERLTSAPYSIRSEYAEKSLHFISSEINPTRRRTGGILLRAGEGATLEEDAGGTINITLGTCGGGSAGIPPLVDVLRLGMMLAVGR